MDIKKTAKNIYKVVRSILFSTIAIVTLLYVALYITLSIPAVQNKIRTIGERELSNFLGSKVEIGDFDFSPFNEVLIKDLKLWTPDNKECLNVGTVGAGISISELILHHKIVITFAELIDLDLKVWQTHPDTPLNIQFVIDSFAPKDKNKPPSRFDLDIRNIVIRRSSLAFDRQYIPGLSPGSLRTVDFNHLQIKDLSADVAIPVLNNDSVRIDLRNLTFEVINGLRVKHLSAKAGISPHSLSLTDFSLVINRSSLTIEDIDLSFSSINQLLSTRTPDNPVKLSITGSKIVPADFKCFFTPLSALTDSYDLSTSLEYNVKGLSMVDFTLFSKQSGLLCDIADLNIVPAPDEDFKDINNLGHSRIDIGKIELLVPTPAGTQLSDMLHIKTPKHAHDILSGIGHIKAEISGYADLSDLSADLSLLADTGMGLIQADLTTVHSNAKDFRDVKLSVDTHDLELSSILPAEHLDHLTVHTVAEITMNETRLKNMRHVTPDELWAIFPHINLQTDIVHAAIDDNSLNDMTVNIDKSPDQLTIAVDALHTILGIGLNADIIRDDGQFSGHLETDMRDLRPGLFIHSPSLDQTLLSGSLKTDFSGSSPETLQGTIDLSSFDFINDRNDKHLHLDNLTLSSYIDNDAEQNLRSTTLSSDWINGTIYSDVCVRDFIPCTFDMVKNIAPGLLAQYYKTPVRTYSTGSVKFAFTIDKSIANQQFIKLPVTPLYNITLDGSIDYSAQTARLSFDAPYLQQGRDKLIRGTRLDLDISDRTANVDFHSTIPTKKGILDLYGDIRAAHDSADIALHFNPVTKGGFYGDMQMRASYFTDLNATGRRASLQFIPSSLYLNGAEWLVGSSDIQYADSKISIDNFTITHDNQFITINGTASQSADDLMVVNLSGINLDYIFDTLNINYVSFGGIATGQAIAGGAFSGSPVANTRGLYVKDLSYNHCILGDARLYGDFDIKQSRVGISANIDEGDRHVADVDGGIWLAGKDSLSFDISADKVRVGFLQTFMQAFSSQVDGRASGHGKLYGTFKDIDMIGRFYADTLSVKVDYTNVAYSAGGDSVFLTPGLVSIPPITLYDSYKNTVKLSGELHHRFFHNPTFHFDIRNADRLLVYDTNANMNPVWYGKIFGTGSGMINGTTDMVEIIADMATERGSDFTFVLDDSMDAADYTFLTFTDTHKRQMEALSITERDEEDAIVAKFNKELQHNNTSSMGFAMDIRASITPDVNMTLVMDPASGDKIVARGSGPLNISYSSVNDEMRMLGKYILNEGRYNFTLQDLIIKDFIIKEGSSVAFNGDPMAAVLNIRAAYRVNTNITDLDRSFANDRDLNRTNVPVDAMLIVSGDMTDPDISFDIEFPTLNEEVAQKVRSIISSDDMMTRQILYLLALNRFYPSDYMGNTNTGGEWASVASSTISSQLQNILGQLTDKFTVAPSLHSDKGDFSDLEVDVALSSRLFNNRLLINGNLGYRDPATSSTTFIGDFDIEYLLTSNGNLRLKAYNHFNDQNYYLKSALTTQGLGIIFKRDFDELLPRKKRKKSDRQPEL
ncbi:MAG: translocation/assembly module TamB [Muribaculaceae bacterium]|nr:translocation/assembly module TamB [Muribaculaceae bacterium]